MRNELGQVEVEILQNGGKPLKDKAFQSKYKGISGKTDRHRTYKKT